jgi:hypothetical protein
MEGKNNINIGHVTKRKKSAVGSGFELGIGHVTKRKKSAVGSGFELGTSHARRMGMKRPNTLTH